MQVRLSPVLLVMRLIMNWRHYGRRGGGKQVRPRWQSVIRNAGFQPVARGLRPEDEPLSVSSMGFFRFRKTISLGKFFRINVSKTGASLSAGRPGATINVRKDRVDGTVGIPGSGLSYKERLSNRGCASVVLFALMLASTLAGVLVWAR